MDSGRESMAKKKNAAVAADKCLDSQLWHACAGGMVQMPAINSKVFYFPQGHAEHSGGSLDLGGGGVNPRIPAMILCSVAGIRYMADSDTDDVYAKIRLIPINHHHHHDSAEDNLDEGEGFDAGSPENNKPASFVKTLTQSDANNGGGFSVPRYCAETIFPRLDYTAEPPVQAILAKDVHGVAWKFRHIYRGTPRRHLLTTGWSNFVNQKRLVAGDSIVFLRAESGDLCVGIRRAKKGLGEYPFVGQYDGGVLSGRSLVSRGESVAEEAARLAAAGREFEVAYYPRGSSGGGGGGGSTPEFCVRAAAVRAAAAIRWCSGMRFKMPFETEDSSRISWFMGTISSVQVADPLRWPDSPWRLLQVAWDEPDLLQNVKRVNPWLVELVANMPPISVSPFSPPRKKLRLPPTPEFPLMGQIPAPFLAGNFLLGGGPFCSVPNTTVPAGIQGARHAQFGQYPSDLRHLSELHPGLPFPFLGFQKLHDPPRNPGVNFINILEKKNENEGNENFSCWLKMGHHPAESLKTAGEEANKTPPQPSPPQLLLFGQVILTEEQLSKSSSGENLSGGSGSTLGRSGSRENYSDGGSPPWYKDRRNGDIGLENGHCTEAQRVALSTLEMSHSGSFVCLN